MPLVGRFGVGVCMIMGTNDMLRNVEVVYGGEIKAGQGSLGARGGC